MVDNLDEPVPRIDIPRPQQSRGIKGLLKRLLRKIIPVHYTYVRYNVKVRRRYNFWDAVRYVAIKLMKVHRKYSKIYRSAAAYMKIKPSLEGYLSYSMGLSDKEMAHMKFSHPELYRRLVTLRGNAERYANWVGEAYTK